MEPRDMTFHSFLKEYEVLRQEINTFNQYRQQLLAGSAALVGVLVAALVATSGKGFDKNFFQENEPFALLILSSVFVTGGLLFVELRVRIGRAADYVHNHLRPKVAKLCHDDEVMRWEAYLAKNGGNFRGKKYFVVDHIGSLMFVLPASFALCRAPFTYTWSWSPEGLLVGLWMLVLAAMIPYTVWISWRLNQPRIASPIV